MTRHVLIPALLAAAVALPPWSPGAGPKPARERGRVKAERTRPDHFPHRIWAACDFEGRTRDYG
jgi:hypothetical protein